MRIRCCRGGSSGGRRQGHSGTRSRLVTRNLQGDGRGRVHQGPLLAVFGGRDPLGGRSGLGLVEAHGYQGSGARLARVQDTAVTREHPAILARQDPAAVIGELVVVVHGVERPQLRVYSGCIRTQFLDRDVSVRTRRQVLAAGLTGELVAVAVLKRSGVLSDPADPVDDERHHGRGRHFQRRGLGRRVDGNRGTLDECVALNVVEGRLGGHHRRDSGPGGDAAEAAEIQGDPFRCRGVIDMHHGGAASVGAEGARGLGVLVLNEEIARPDVVREIPGGVVLLVGQNLALGGFSAVSVVEPAVGKPLTAFVVAVKVDIDGPPAFVGLFLLVGILDWLPEHPGVRLQLAEIVDYAAGDAQTVGDVGAVPATGGVADRRVTRPEAADFAHPEWLVRGVGKVAHPPAVIGAVRVDVQLGDSVLGFLGVAVPVGHELCRVCLVHRGDDGVRGGAVLGQFGGEQPGDTILGSRIDQGPLLLLSVGGGGLAGGGVDVGTPIAGVWLIEGIDGVHLDAAALFQQFDSVLHVSRELGFRLGQQVLTLIRIDLTRHVTALGHEPRWRVAERLPMRDLLLGCQLFHPPALVLVSFRVVGRGIVRVPLIQERQLVRMRRVQRTIGPVEV